MVAVVATQIAEMRESVRRNCMWFLYVDVSHVSQEFHGPRKKKRKWWNGRRRRMKWNAKYSRSVFSWRKVDVLCRPQSVAGIAWIRFSCICFSNFWPNPNGGERLQGPIFVFGGTLRTDYVLLRSACVDVWTTQFPSTIFNADFPICSFPSTTTDILSHDFIPPSSSQRKIINPQNRKPEECGWMLFSSFSLFFFVVVVDTIFRRSRQQPFLPFSFFSPF